jgi:hypothetical protein
VCHVSFLSLQGTLAFPGERANSLVQRGGNHSPVTCAEKLAK